MNCITRILTLRDNTFKYINRLNSSLFLLESVFFRYDVIKTGLRNVPILLQFEGGVICRRRILHKLA